MISKVVFCTAFLGLVFWSCTDDNPASTSGTIPPKIPFTEMVEIPAGTFNMGYDGPERSPYEYPVCVVTITKPFYIGKYEVTRKHWESLMTPTKPKYVGDSIPVSYISMDSAVVFCNKLSIQHGLEKAYTILPDKILWNKQANGYRLPTEAEWELACRAGTTTHTYNGNLASYRIFDPDPVLTPIAWYGLSEPYPHKVGLKKPNQYGLYDMLGNISEWCWVTTVEYTNESKVDPGPEWSSKHVVRGGSFRTSTGDCTAGVRHAVATNYQDEYRGLRLARNK